MHQSADQKSFIKKKQKSAVQAGKCEEYRGRSMPGLCVHAVGSIAKDWAGEHLTMGND